MNSSSSLHSREPTSFKRRWQALAAAACGLLALSCTPAPKALDADVIVVGAGIAGLSAALEAAEAGARVLVLDTNSVGGGHAVKAGGFALVDTELQRSKGIADSPELAFSDWLERGVDPDAYWADRYARESSADVYNWLTALGVEFRMVLNTQEDSVPRFHFTRGTAVNAVVPMMRKALTDARISFVWNTRVTALARVRGTIAGVSAVNLRTRQRMRYRGAAVILSTGGFESDLDAVRANWPAEQLPPKRLLSGAGHFATGDGLTMAAWAGADLRDLDRHVIFDNAVPNPRDTAGQRGLFAQNPAALWVDASGRRFINESAPESVVTRQLEQMSPRGYWLIFDEVGAKRFSLRDAPWLNKASIRAEILENPEITVQAASLAELARKSGLPEHGLRTTQQTWNRMVDMGEDFRFGRFAPDLNNRNIRPLSTPPYYAVKLYPMTRKSMGGPRINVRAQVVDVAGRPVSGLYAAGELTGAVGINGRYGGAGTFLGPAVLTGRIAGRAAASEAGTALAYNQRKRPPARRGNLQARASDPGYWHYGVAHALVAERGYECGSCHVSPESMRPAQTRAIMLERLETCVTCH